MFRRRTADHRPYPSPSRRGARRVAAFVLVLLLLSLSVLNGNASSGQRRETGIEFIVIVNVNNPLRAMSRTQLAAYFLKRRATWPNGTAVDPVDLPPDSRARSAFSRDVLRRSPNDVSAYWVQEIFAGRSEPPDVKNSEAAVVFHVSALAGAIGYVSTTPVDASVRVLVVTP